MMDHRTKEILRSFAWAATIGAGRLEESEPDRDALDTLSFILKRSLTADDLSFLEREWDRCVQEANQP